MFPNFCPENSIPIGVRSVGAELRSSDAIVAVAVADFDVPGSVGMLLSPVQNRYSSHHIEKNSRESIFSMFTSRSMAMAIVSLALLEMVDSGTCKSINMFDL